MSKAMEGQPLKGVYACTHCDKTNNAATNLEWSTFDDNFAHGRAAGRALAINNPKVRHKLSSDDVKRIRERYAANERIRDITRDYPHCGYSQIHRVAHGKSRRFE